MTLGCLLVTKLVIKKNNLVEQKKEQENKFK